MLLSEFVSAACGTLHQMSEDFEIERATGFDAAGPHDICVVASKKVNDEALGSKAGAFIVGRGNVLEGRTCIEVDDPWLVMVALLNELHPPAAVRWFSGVHPSALIHETAQLGESVTVGPNAVIGPNVVIGKDTYICAGVVIGPNVKIGEECLFESNVVLEANTQIGNRVIIHAGSVIGSDGFKYEIVSVGRIKIPQVGCVIIEDDCEIGSCTCIDRAGFTETRIGARTKIDNLVQIGHNVVTGTDCCIVSQTGVAGSCKLGNWVTLAARAGIADHINLDDQSIVMANTGVMRDVAKGEYIAGTPGRPMRQMFRIIAAEDKLPDMVKDLRKLSKRVEELEARLKEKEK